MAKYVLLQFDKDEDADAFVNILVQDEVSNPTKVTIRALGVYKKPTQFCACPDRLDPNAKSVVGKKFGWYVHAACGKPRANGWHGPKNLLRPDEHHGRRRLNLMVVEPQPDSYERMPGTTS
jgi:hypothetical protein